MQLLLNFPLTIPNIKEAWEHSEAYKYAPASDTSVNDAIELSLKVDKFLAPFLMTYIFALIAFFCLALVYRKKPEHPVTLIISRHKRKIQAFIIITQILLLAAWLWVSSHPSMTQEPFMLEALEAIRKAK